MSNLFNPPKYVEGNLIGQDGNAFSLIGYFTARANAAGWNNEEIVQVREEAMAGDYNHLLRVLMTHMKPSRESYYDDSYDEETG